MININMCDAQTQTCIIVPHVCNIFNQFFIMPCESDSEDDEDIINIHLNRLWTRLHTVETPPHRIKLFVEETILQSTDKEFQSHFRVTREVFEVLLQRISPHLQNNNGTGKPTIDPRKQLLAVLWLLATPDSYRSVACRFDLGKSSLFHCFVRVIKALNILAPTTITWPRGERAVNVSNHFRRLAGISGVIGAVDGTYVPIKAPSEHPENYINRKCFHAITLQGICDHERRFTDVFTGYPSSVSDIRIFRNSDIYRSISENRNNYFEDGNFIIGDKAYPITSWCVPPYIDRGNMLARHRHFNHLHASTRQIIERTFALLFGRLRRLRYLDMNRLDLIPSTIVAACVIHNICLSYVDEQLNVYEQEGQNYVQHDDNGEDHIFYNHHNEHEEGIALRNRLAQDLFIRRL